MPHAPTTVDFPAALPVRRAGKGWRLLADGIEQKVSNLDKPYWAPEGYTKADLLGYYHNAAPWILPYLRDRPLTMKRMPDGADGEFFYAKQAPGHTPPWVRTAPVTSRDTGKTIDYVLADDRPGLLWLANLGCIEVHPWHARIDDIAHPDYAFFDLDPMPDVGFDWVRDVALLVRTALEQLGIRGYPRTSGATGMQVYVPLDRVHTAAQVRDWVGQVCKLIHRADPERTSMAFTIADRGRTVFLDHGMNTEGKNIAATYSLRPERAAPVATPLRWDEVATDVEPQDFTIASIWQRLDEVGDLFAPVLQGGQDLTAAMQALGMDPADPVERSGHDVGTPKEKLAKYTSMRDFGRTPEPPGDPAPDPPPPGTPAAPEPSTGPRFVLQHHLATRLHHDLRLERDGVAVSWALPKGLPDVPGVRHLAVQTEDHPLEYMAFSGEIPEGEYGGGPVRIWDAGTYEALEWRDGKVTFRVHGRRHRGEYHLFRTGSASAPEQWMVTRADEPEPGELPPAPPRLAPMLATSADEPFDDPGWLFEVKWDGVRAVATTTRPGTDAPAATHLVSRQDNDITAGYPELASLWERVLARNAVLDGEIVALGPGGVPSFQRLQSRMHVRDPAAVERLRRQIPVTFMAFDLLAVDGELLVDLPLRDRLERLDEILVPGVAVQRSAAVRADGEALYAAAAARGLEGVVAKRLDSRYQPGRRSRDWLKIKVRHTLCCVIGGWLPGEGSRTGRLGSLLLGLHDNGKLRYVGRCGTGFDAAELARLQPILEARAADRAPFAAGPAPPRGGRWLRPELVCRVEYSEATAAGVLRAPSYKGLRPDESPDTCVFDDLDVRE
jgi:bifunctional non-homologous end joining protein LigD